MQKYIIIIILLLILYCLDYNFINYNYINYKYIENMGTFQNKNIISTVDVPESDWSIHWNKLDFKARENANCTPIARDYTKLGTHNTWILTMPKSCENGMPHTRAVDIIAMPVGFPKDHMASTLEHEKIHLNQRMYFYDWKKFYKQYWQYELFESPPTSMPEDLVKMKRANPDTCLAPYCCWKNTWWSIPVYKSLTNLDFRNSPVKWWNQKLNKVYDEPPNEWIKFFGTQVGQSEHPNEISAVYIAGWFFNRKTTDECDGLRTLISKWDVKKERLFL